MKRLRCPKCEGSLIAPPPEGKRKWVCTACGNKFKISSKDAGKIIRRSDEENIDLGPIESHLIAAILHTKSKKQKNKKNSKVKKAKNGS